MHKNAVTSFTLPAPKICRVCTSRVYPMDCIHVDDAYLHQNCFKCQKCQIKLKIGSHVTAKGEFYCKLHSPNKGLNNVQREGNRKSFEDIKIGNQPIKMEIEKILKKSLKEKWKLPNLVPKKIPSLPKKERKPSKIEMKQPIFKLPSFPKKSNLLCTNKEISDEMNSNVLVKLGNSKIKANFMDEEVFPIIVNEAGIQSLLKDSTNEISNVISFIGDHKSGKSTIINEFMNYSNCYNISISENIKPRIIYNKCTFKGTEKYKVTFLESEIPEQFQKCTFEQFCRFLYQISNIIVYTTNQSLANFNFYKFTDLVQNYMTLNISSQLPNLVIILNNQKLEKIRSFKKCTKLFLKLFDKKDHLKKYFKEVMVIELPNMDSMEFKNRIQDLYSKIIPEILSNQIIKRKMKGNLISEKIFVSFFREVIHNFNSKRNIPIGSILSQIQAPEDSLERKALEYFNLLEMSFEHSREFTFQFLACIAVRSLDKFNRTQKTNDILCSLIQLLDKLKPCQSIFRDAKQSFKCCRIKCDHDDYHLNRNPNSMIGWPNIVSWTGKFEYKELKTWQYIINEFWNYFERLERSPEKNILLDQVKLFKKIKFKDWPTKWCKICWMEDEIQELECRHLFCKTCISFLGNCPICTKFK